MEPTTSAPASTGLIERYFTEDGVDPLDQVAWVRRDAWPTVEKYHQPNIEVPDFWSQEALDITSKLYLAKGDYTETSVRQLIERVAGKITVEGVVHGYFERGDFGLHADPAVDADPLALYPSAQIFYAELCYVLVNQLATFNSPVWFNVGREDRPQQVSACFLLGVADNTEAIMANGRREAHIFKLGSGSGTNLSPLRGMHEPLSTGGLASGPTSFMRLYDAGAGTFKSGGMTRRAACLRRLDVDHPDIEEFIELKPREEHRLRILAAAGVDISMDAEGERNVAEATAFQNANNSVGVTDEFMQLATMNPEVEDDSWDLLRRVEGAVDRTVHAVGLLDKIAQAAWACADPGMQYDTTINTWHTTPAQGRITTSNPCGEYYSNDDTSCNLGSVNVLKFVEDTTAGHDPLVAGLKGFDTVGYQRTVDVMATAMDILISFADYPDDESRGGDGLIGRRTRGLRQLGLGYSNMGAAIMAQGLAYDSDEARDFAAAVTALNTGRIYRQSAIVAEKMGAFEHFKENRKPMLNVIEMHMSRLPDLFEPGPRFDFESIWHAAVEAWHSARDRGMVHGFRNAQASVLPPAGTTSYQLGCDTTGIEPAFALVSHKTIAGGGNMVLVNRSVERGLEALDYNEMQRASLTGLLEEGDVATFMEALEPSHQAVFHGAGEISPEGHLKMVAAVQPFVSGGITKTINLAEHVTWQEIRDMYVLAWRLGCKGISIYRDNSKVRQVLATKPKATIEVPMVETITVEEAKRALELPGAETPYAEDQYEGHVGPGRRRMPRDADMIRHKLNVGGFEGYLLIGKYEDGSPGEFFLEDIGKEGSFVRGMINAWAISVSISVQSGTPWEMLIRKYVNMNFEPNGPTENAQIPHAHSLPDYIMRYIALRFFPELHEELGIMTDAVKAKKVAALDLSAAVAATVSIDPEGSVRIDHDELEHRIAAQIGAVRASSPSSNGRMLTLQDQTAGLCPTGCGNMMRRVGSCLQCVCGHNTGCG